MSGDSAFNGSGAAPAPAGADPLAAMLNADRQNDPTPAANIGDLIADQTRPTPAEVFNPDIHESANGAPIKNKDGSYRIKRGRGSPRHRQQNDQADAGAGAIDQAADPGEPTRPPAPYGAAEARRDAVLAVGMLTGSLQGWLGPKWKPEDDEREQMIGELASYCELNGGLGIPPWLGVVIAFGGYAGRRVELPGGLSAKLLGDGSDVAEIPVERINPPADPIQQQPASQARSKPTSNGNGTATTNSRPPVRLSK